MEQTNAESSNTVLPTDGATANVEDEERSAAASTQLPDEGNSDSLTVPEANLDEGKKVDHPNVTSACAGDEHPTSSQKKTDEKSDLILQLDEENSEEGQNTQANSANVPDKSSITISAGENRNHNIVDGDKSPASKSQVSDNVLDEFLKLKVPHESSLMTSDERSEEKDKEFSNSQETSREDPGRDKSSDLIDKAGNEEGETKKLEKPAPIKNNEKSIGDERAPSSNRESENSSNTATGILSEMNNVEKDLYSLFSDSDKVDNSDNFKTDSFPTKTEAEIGNSRIETNEPGNSSTELLRNKKLQIKDVNKLRELHNILEGEDKNPEGGSDLPAASDFTPDRIEIKEEIESIGNVSIRSNDDDNISYSSECQLQNNLTDLCKKDCFVLLERCDDSLLYVSDHYQSDMKIVSVRSLSSLNFTDKYNIVWSYFTKKSPTQAECKICGQSLLHGKLYNLTRHLQTVHDHNSSATNTELDKSPVTATAKSNRSSKFVHDPALMKENPINFFLFVNSQTARCKLCYQYFKYKCLDDIVTLRSHLTNKHMKTEDSKNYNLKARKSVSRDSCSNDDDDDGDDDYDDDDYDDDDDDDNEYEGDSNKESSAKVGIRKPRQRTWAHFTKMERGLAQCNTCHKCFSYGGGNLRSLTRHLKMGHNDQKSANQSSQKTAPKHVEKTTKVLKKIQNSQAISKNSKSTRQGPAGKQFLKYFSFLRSNNALCKKCMTKIPFNKQDTTSLLNHYHKCNPAADSLKKNSKKGRVAGTHNKDGSINDPDFVSPDLFEDEYVANKTQLMAAVELSPRDKLLNSNHFKKVNGNTVECVHCLKRLPYKNGDMLQMEQHLQLWHDKSLNNSKNDDKSGTSLDDIPLLFRLKNQPQPYSLSDCYYRKKLQYNVVEIGRYFRRLGDSKLLCKLCSQHLQCRETSTEILMSHILQEHVRKLFKPRHSSNEANSMESTQTPVKQLPSQTTTSPQMKSISTNLPPLTRQKVQAQSTPLPSKNQPVATQKGAAKTAKPLLSQLYANINNIEPSRYEFTLRYFIDFGPNRQKCKICNRQFSGNKTSNFPLLSKHLLSSHLKIVVDDETQLLKSGENDVRKAIINCTRQRIVNKFSEIDDQKISCKICSCHLQNHGFDTMKTHLLKSHQNYLLTILKEVKRIQNYNNNNLRKTKRLLTLRKKRVLRAKCSLCFREVCYKAGNTRRLYAHLLKLHRKAISKIQISKIMIWKYFSKQNFAGSKCEICFKFISSKVHCNHKVPKLFCLSTGLKLKQKKESKPHKNACFYFSALKQYNSECIFCSKSLKNANKIICKIACRFNHGNEYINWLYKNDPVDQSFVSSNQSDGTLQKTLTLIEMFEELKNKKINSIKLCYSEFSNKYHCNLCSENISAKYLRFCLYFDHAFQKHKGLLSMHRTLLKNSNDATQPRSVMSALKSAQKSSPQNMQKNTKLVKVKLWHHFKVIGPDLASCNFCKVNFRYTTSNVDNLSNHLRVTHLDALLKLSEATSNSQPPPTQPHAPHPTNAKMRKSSTWNYFIESNRGAKCKLCGKQFLFSMETRVSPLTRHLLQVHNIKPAPEGSPIKTGDNEIAQAGNDNTVSKEQETWAWQYFEKSDTQPGTAKCKLCLNNHRISSEKGDLSSAMIKHLRLIHNKWLVQHGVNNTEQNNKGSKRQADTDMDDSSLVDQGRKKVKFNDSVDAVNEDTVQTVPTTSSYAKGNNEHSSEGAKVSNQEVISNKGKKLLSRLQEVEKSKSKKSLVWTYFTQIDGQPDFSRCNICSKSISSKFGVSILRTHLRVKHNILIVNMNQYSELKKSIGDTCSSDTLIDTLSKKTSINLPSGKEQIVSPTKVNSKDTDVKDPPASSKKSENSLLSKFDKNHPVWTYFTKDRNGILSKCNLCMVYLSSKSGPEILQTHLRAKHNIVFVDADPLKNVSIVSGNKSSPVQVSSTNQTVEKSGKQSIKKLFMDFPKPAEELNETTNVEESEEPATQSYVVESTVENEVFYTTDDNLVTVTEGGDPSSETVHYEIVETTEEESTDIVRVISDLLPNYSTGISDDVHATEISPQESELISNIVTSLSNPEDQTSSQQVSDGDGDQLKSIAVLTGETEDASLTWDFYVKLGENKVKCDVCSEVLTYEHEDAEHLRDHIQSKHPAELAQYKLARLDFSDSCIIVVKNAN